MGNNTGIASINPATGKTLQVFSAHSPTELEQRLNLAWSRFTAGRHDSLATRATWLSRTAEILLAEKAEFGKVMTLEMGKPIRAAIQEVEKCAGACRYYAENAADFLAEEPLVSGPSRISIRYQPLGPVLAVMPWNFPFWQVFRFAAPALMAGNTGLLKHASNVPQCALALEDIFRRAGWPEGSFQTLLAGSAAVRGIIEDDRIRAVTLTGSVEAGRKVASAAGAQIKKTVLELGGSDPFIVMPTADLDHAAATAVQARTINNGQSCIAAKRFIVHERVAEEFESRFVERMAALTVGDPMDPSTDIGPLATAKVREDLERQVNESVTLGARVLLGGKRLAGEGFFYAPTVLRNVPPGSPAYREELFGPVASLFTVKNLEEALRLANDTGFGLGSCIWTTDPGEREAFIDEIEAGSAFVNAMVASDPRAPFGGVKLSGYGRELSKQGIREFVNAKTVVIAGQGAATVKRTD